MRKTPHPDDIFFELLERTLRLYNHVRRSIASSKQPMRRQTAQRVIADHVLRESSLLTRSAVETYFNARLSYAQKLQALQMQYELLAKFHQWSLVTVPRPCEPIELVSYLRQARSTGHDIAKGPVRELLVYATEYLGDQAHQSLSQRTDPKERPELLYVQALLKTNDLSGLSQLALEELTGSPELVNTEPPDIQKRGYVSLPRLDLGNPLRWPSLLHEVAHFDVDRHQLWSDFVSAESPERLETLRLAVVAFGNKGDGPGGKSPADSSRDTGREDEELTYWLTECWCDAKATYMSGAATLFAQAQSFSFSVPCYLTHVPRWEKYPPAWFRLRLMRSLIQTRESSGDGARGVNIEESIQDLWDQLGATFPDKCSLETCVELQPIFYAFRRFLSSRFPPNQWAHHSVIASEGFEKLVEDLGSGLPIPSVGDSDNNAQRAATHAEILVAGWIHRQGAYRDQLLAAAEHLNSSNFKDAEFERLAALVDRADAVLQTSIQSSEWFSILRPHDADTVKNEASAVPTMTFLATSVEVAGKESAGGAECKVELTPDDLANPLLVDRPKGSLLNDKEILALLDKRELRVIPGLNPKLDVAGSVIDLRLGHNFEVFFPNVRGAYDPMSTNQGEITSMEIDVDSLDGLELMPGQFVLAHTLEFLALPESVAAQIEGRSSFARLGVQVHMTANLVEAGFRGCLTLEIANQGHSAVKLYPGLRIAQLRLFALSGAPASSYSRRTDTKFRGMLRHGRTRQFDDWELEALRLERIKRGA